MAFILRTVTVCFLGAALLLPLWARGGAAGMAQSPLPPGLETPAWLAAPPGADRPILARLRAVKAEIHDAVCRDGRDYCLAGLCLPTARSDGCVPAGLSRAGQTEHPL